ncbi:MAG: ClpXP protease specificity-enhancing factor SspB [Octadecabacter sp.]|nr:ClpXP protease specificity-enhancing factor SspB [Octadecabacter sp.]
MNKITNSELSPVSITNQSIDYGNLMHKAMRGLILEVLTDVCSKGLPGNHHFFITFDTMHPDVEIADWLSDRYPGEMTIVIQHQYESLKVTNQGFSITLSFGDKFEPLYVPYNAIKTFVDPSVEFGLRFEAQEKEDGSAPEAPMDVMVEPKKEMHKKDADIVSLDQFRK